MTDQARKKPESKGELKKQLLVANKEYVLCMRREYMIPFLQGKTVNCADVCIAEHKAMKELDLLVYGAAKLPQFPEIQRGPAPQPPTS